MNKQKKGEMVICLQNKTIEIKLSLNLQMYAAFFQTFWNHS